MTQRDEPLIFSKDENAVWTVDRNMVDEQLPELIDKLKTFQRIQACCQGDQALRIRDIPSILLL